VAARASTKKNRLLFRSVKQLCGEKLAASDGQIGRVKDFYFDDQNWVVRYLVADTGSWLAKNPVRRGVCIHR
jgi:hypothetical protein